MKGHQPGTTAVGPIAHLRHVLQQTHNCGGRPCYEGMETLAKLNQCQVNDVLRTLALSLVICRRLCFLVQNLQISTLVTPT